MVAVGLSLVKAAGGLHMLSEGQMPVARGLLGKRQTIGAILIFVGAVLVGRDSSRVRVGSDVAGECSEARSDGAAVGRAAQASCQPAILVTAPRWRPTLDMPVHS